MQQGADLHMAQLMPLPLTVFASVKSRLALPFWYWLTWVVLEKGPLNVCVLLDYIVRQIIKKHHSQCKLLTPFCLVGMLNRSPLL